MKQEKYEPIPVGGRPAHGELCESTQLACLYETEARKEVRKFPSFQGSIHQALPHDFCGWWHIYMRPASRRNAAQRKKDWREEQELRRRIEGDRK